ncbi:hypothetical protein NEMIN01_2425, partial [Nematocida minor]|uniref:uncharacterized protein n=1 Tax=Nematocida minor TaxID=1912983 RepID=UPI00221F3FB1
GNLNSTGFGNNNMNTTGFGNANTTSFGNTNTTGFGNTGVTPGLGGSPLSASSGGLGGFGATSTGFGATSTNTGFGSSTNTFGAASSGLGNAFGNTTGFGGGTSSTAFGNAFGNTTGIGLSGANQSANASSNSIINSSLRNTTGSIDDVHCTIDYLEKAYDKNSPMYKFSYTFYNLIDPSSPAPQKPSNVSNELWAQANSLNPYPGYLYPEIIFGHDELSLRLEKQKSVIDKLKISRKYLGDRLNELKEGGILKLTNKLASINEKYNSLLVEVLEQAGKSLGPEIKSVSSQYNQLEKRSNLLGDGLTSLSENVLAYKREFIPSAQDKTQAILEEQSSILENMLISVKKKLSE